MGETHTHTHSNAHAECLLHSWGPSGSRPPALVVGQRSRAVQRVRAGRPEEALTGPLACRWCQVTGAGGWTLAVAASENISETLCRERKTKPAAPSRIPVRILKLDNKRFNALTQREINKSKMQVSAL